MKHQILLDSGFGRYLVGKLPKAIANEFLYRQPSLLLWADELLCDANALEAEAQWSDDGFLVSELSIMLRDRGIIKSKDFAPYFEHDRISDLLVASQADVEASHDARLFQYSTPDPSEIGHYANTGFDDVNALLYLSSLVGLPHLNTEPANRFYEWKFASLAKSNRLQPPDERGRGLLSEILRFTVPQFELFPRTDAFRRAEETKQDLLTVATAVGSGQANVRHLQEIYGSYLARWREYDNSVRSEVLDNFAMLVEMRDDRRLRSLRGFLESFAETVRRNPGEPNFDQEVSLRLRREIAEIERSIAEESKAFDFLDKYASFSSFPVEFAGAVAGVAATAVTMNPLFVALGLAPSFLGWSAKQVADFRQRRFSWHYYLLDVKARVERAKELRDLDRRIAELGA